MTLSGIYERVRDTGVYVQCTMADENAARHDSSSDEEGKAVKARRDADVAAMASASDAVPVNSKRAARSRTRSRGVGNRSVSTVPQRPPPPLQPDASGKVPVTNTQSTTSLGENYTDDEVKLSTFMKLHPFLSIDATSKRALQLAADVLDTTSIPAKELPLVGRIHDNGFLRAADLRIGERACCIGDRCIGRFIAILRYGDSTDMATTLREYLLPDEEQAFRSSGSLPHTVGKCLLCTRYFTTYAYRLARADPCFNPTSKLPIFAYTNVIGHASGEEMVTHASRVGMCEDSYPTSALLGVDAEFSKNDASRGVMGTLIHRPVVGFNSGHYTYVKNERGVTIVQDFGGPGGGTDSRRPAVLI